MRESVVPSHVNQGCATTEAWIKPQRQKEFYVSRLSKTLTKYGIVEDPKMFVDRLVEIFQGMYPAFTIDKLLIRPREAHRYCDAVRAAYKNFDLPDYPILGSLLNRRKHG
jgi:hypothetical protein